MGSLCNYVFSHHKGATQVFLSTIFAGYCTLKHLSIIRFVSVWYETNNQLALVSSNFLEMSIYK